LHKHVLPFAVLAGLLLATSACQFYSHEDLSFRAPVVVTKGGLYDPGRLVSFAANKLKQNGGTVTGSRLTGDRFTDLLGCADFVFGYNLEFDPDRDIYGSFMEGARVVASVDYNGTLYTDTVAVYPPFQRPSGECTTDTLRIDLPAR
jgi:hypothetical protein